jgi:hypothetical protein
MEVVVVVVVIVDDEDGSVAVLGVVGCENISSSCNNKDDSFFSCQITNRQEK